ncbi:MAG: hypothetical protein CL853_05025 [Crocinitomicaceae bacterium]|nr:hypothetical protein [Crocinitomicaceae bacterium]|tara:strand:+ start:437 stop:964 length:528 start_codon:yes stop_codon:yes gene_type:complete
MNDNIKIGLLIVILAMVSLNTYKIFQIENVDVGKKVEAAPVKEKSKNLINKAQEIPPSNPLINEAAMGPLTTIFFDTEEKDFGNVNIDTENKYSFEFINNGTEPLKISNARGSCGCTVPDWPKHPIMPGQKGKIDVVFKPNKSQAGKPQQKTVTVTANTKPANTVLNIKAFVNPE